MATKNVKLKNENGDILYPQTTQSNVDGLATALASKVDISSVSTINGTSILNGGNVVIAAEPNARYIFSYDDSNLYYPNPMYDILYYQKELHLEFRSKLYYDSMNYILASALQINDAIIFDSPNVYDYYVAGFGDDYVILKPLVEKNGVGIEIAGTTGQLNTHEQELLKRNTSNYLVRNSEIYKLNDNEHQNNLMIYSCVDIDPVTENNVTTYNFCVKCILVNAITRDWEYMERHITDSLASAQVMGGTNTLYIYDSEGNATTFKPIDSETKLVSALTKSYVRSCLKMYYNDSGNDYEVLCNFVNSAAQCFYFNSSGVKTDLQSTDTITCVRNTITIS